MDTYLSFINKCLQDNKTFINYIDFNNKRPTLQNKHEDLEETQTRALWSLGVIMNNKTLSKKIKNEAVRIFLLRLGNGLKLRHLRAQAFAIKAFVLAQQALPGHYS